MLNIFYFLAILIRSIFALNVPDAIQSRSSSEYGRYTFAVPASKSEPANTDCQYNNTNPSSSVAGDYSNCVSTRSGNPGTIQYHDSETFAEDFTKTMLSIPAMQRFLKKQITVSETKGSIYELEYPAFDFAETLVVFDDSPLPMYFTVVGTTIAKFLQNHKIAVGRNAVGCYAYFLERAVRPDCVHSDQVLYQAFFDTYVNFVNSLGFNFLENSDSLIQLVISEFVAFSKK